MTQNDIEPKQLSIGELFAEEQSKYVIPIYQRNYAWKKPQILQLIDDIADFALANQSPKKNYYIGSLVVFQRSKDGIINLETIDGQQRLTTIFILLCVLKNKFGQNINFKQNLVFESREISSISLQAIFEGKVDEASRKQDLNIGILNAYQYILTALNKIEKNKINNLCLYLLQNVKLIKIPLPEDTDLNHYFEIMNNRGEQLEKHEILKAKMLKTLTKDKKASTLFNLIWEACSNMEKYVQYGFSPTQRNQLFGRKNQTDKDGWHYFNANNFADIQQLVDADTEQDNNAKEIIKTQANDSTQQPDKDLTSKRNTIQEIIKIQANDSPHQTHKEAASERFTSPINFANFLLHVLRIQTKQNIPLDDKQLLIVFADDDINIVFVKKFAFNLLKLRFLLDKYIIKRHIEQDQWSLQKLLRSKNKNTYSGYYANTFENENKNKQILMLLSMFHVSNPTLIYKHWLNASLKYLSEQEDISADNYADYLEKLANAFLYDRYLAKEPKDYFELIYTNHTTSKNTIDDLNKSLLNKGTQVENFIFNYLDYQLWKNERYTKFIQGNTNAKYKNFIFSFRSSVEHFYPQNPIENIEELDGEHLNNFGNLCLIARSQNSRLSNFTPKAKTDFYTKNRVKDSIKQGIMMSYEKWEEHEINEHSELMKKLLLENCKNTSDTD